jgi:hypothetical protein
MQLAKSGRAKLFLVRPGHFRHFANSISTLSNWAAIVTDEIQHWHTVVLTVVIGSVKRLSL